MRRWARLRARHRPRSSTATHGISACPSLSGVRKNRSGWPPTVAMCNGSTVTAPSLALTVGQICFCRQSGDMCTFDSASPRNCLRRTHQKGLAFVREQSGTMTVPGATRPRDSAPPAAWPRWGCGGGGNDAAPTQWRIPMARLTDTQLVILSTASRRNDRGVDLPTNVTGEAVQKTVEARRCRDIRARDRSWVTRGAPPA